MNNTDFNEFFTKNGITPDGQSKIDSILEVGERTLHIAQKFAIEGHAEMQYFFISEDGTTMFSPSLHMPPAMVGSEEFKHFLGVALRGGCKELDAYSLISIAEAWIGPDNPSPEDIEWMEEHGVGNHPQSKDVLMCNVDFCVRGKAKRFFRTLDVVTDDDGNNRNCTNDTGWMDYSDAEGNLVVEAECFVSIE